MPTIANELSLNYINIYENASPEGIKIVLEGFDNCDFQPSVLTYQYNATCPTRGNDVLDKMFCNVRNGYRAYKKPKLRNSDNNMMFFWL